jgi:hypothetical protein
MSRPVDFDGSPHRNSFGMRHFARNGICAFPAEAAATVADRRGPIAKIGHRVRLGVAVDTTLTHGGHFLELT